jgi:hypothetical protein
VFAICRGTQKVIGFVDIIGDYNLDLSILVGNFDGLHKIIIEFIGMYAIGRLHGNLLGYRILK